MKKKWWLSHPHNNGRGMKVSKRMLRRGVEGMDSVLIERRASRKRSLLEWKCIRSITLLRIIRWYYKCTTIFTAPHWVILDYHILLYNFLISTAFFSLSIYVFCMASINVYKCCLGEAEETSYYYQNRTEQSRSKVEVPEAADTKK